MKKIAIYLALTLSLLLLLTACGNKTTDTSAATPTPEPAAVIAEGHLVPRDNLYLAFPARGRVAEILVHKGDRVTERQVLIRLGDRQPAQAALAAAQLELTSAQQAYDALVRTADLGRAQATLHPAEAASSARVCPFCLPR
jgi:multidrug efflux pump subunit AcrA (membrane-fusion protein)